MTCIPGAGSVEDNLQNSLAPVSPIIELWAQLVTLPLETKGMLIMGWIPGYGSLYMVHPFISAPNFVSVTPSMGVLLELETKHPWKELRFILNINCISNLSFFICV
jgi:hypothetical protein